MSRFADQKAVTRYDLSDGDWVEFRNDLSFAERRAVEAGAIRGKLDKESKEVDVDIDWPAYEVVRLSGWISDWSFAGPDGKKVPPTKKWVYDLTQSSADELTALLDKHIESLDGSGKASGESF